MSEVREIHVADRAEEYALGLLAEPVAQHVLTHTIACEACRDRVRDAEENVTALIEAQDLEEPPAALRGRIARSFGNRPAPARYVWGALAAALLLWIVPAGWFYAQSRNAQNAASSQSVAFGALVHSHFMHAQFAAIQPGAPDAKVIFARSGAWLFVVIAAPPGDLAIGTETANGLRILGRPTGTNGASEFYLRTRERLSNVVILRGGRTVARATMTGSERAK